MRQTCVYKRSEKVNRQEKEHTEESESRMCLLLACFVESFSTYVCCLQMYSLVDGPLCQQKIRKEEIINTISTTRGPNKAFSVHNFFGEHSQVVYLNHISKVLYWGKMYF